MKLLFFLYAGQYGRTSSPASKFPQNHGEQQIIHIGLSYMEPNNIRVSSPACYVVVIIEHVSLMKSSLQFKIYWDVKMYYTPFSNEGYIQNGLKEKFSICSDLKYVQVLYGMHACVYLQIYTHSPKVAIPYCKQHKLRGRMCLSRRVCFTLALFPTIRKYFALSDKQLALLSCNPGKPYFLLKCFLF